MFHSFDKDNEVLKVPHSWVAIMHCLKHFNTSGIKLFFKDQNVLIASFLAHICRLQYEIRKFRTASNECARPGNVAKVLYCATVYRATSICSY